MGTQIAPSDQTGRRREPSPPRLAAEHVSKSFGGERALDDVHLTVEAKEIHGLLGENGSGKSTLIKILAGFHAPDEGARLAIDGQEVELPLKAGDFKRLNMSFVHQHLGLISSLRVIENLFMPRMATTRARYLNWRRVRREARAILQRFGLELDIDVRVGRLPQVDRALLAIVRAATELGEGQGAQGGSAEGLEHGILVLDEPTVFLSEEGLERLFGLMRNVVSEGASVIFVSHDLDEVRAVTDRATVLRDGRVVGTVLSRNATKDELVKMIVGRELEALQQRPARPSRRGVALSVRRLASTVTPVADVSFDLYAGEILGLTGLVGSGFHEVPYLVYGAWPGTTGEMAIGERRFDLSRMTPAKALAAGIALLPADRQRDGSIGSLTVADNAMMQVLDEYFTTMLLHRRRMLHDAGGALGRFDVRPNRPGMLYQSLSGGNQQKVLLAKWLQTDPGLLLLHEPTQGVDVGARVQIFQVLRAVAARGTAVLCASSDYEQLEQICDRALIMAGGRVLTELAGADLKRERITEQSLTAHDVVQKRVTMGA